MLQNILSPEGGHVLNRSRLWWEIALNLQILCVALMWFCYSERIDRAKGQQRFLQKLRRWIGIASVMVPSIFGLFGVFLGWFNSPPSATTMIYIAAAVLLHWLLALGIQRLVQRSSGTSRRKLALGQRLAFYMPTLVLVVALAAGMLLGDIMWLLAIPLFVYLQGSMPFFFYAFADR